MEKRAFIAVDVQNTFIEGGELGVSGGSRVAHDIAEYLKDHKDEYDLIISSQDWHIDPHEHFSDNPDFVDTWPAHGVANTFGAQLHHELEDFPFDVQIKKGMYEAAYSAFEGVDKDGQSLSDVLHSAGISSLDVSGLALSHCVLQTALDAKQEGFEVNVIRDLSEPTSEELGIKAEEALKDAQINLVYSQK
ncbi:MAG: isochorismatase family protein [Coriobacteriia bacterium]|nr:isochorismatase family protein [Coriobacteriia bacterium]